MYKKKASGWLKHLDFLLIDIICFHFAFCISYIIRHGWLNPYERIMYRNMSIVASIVLVFVVACSNTFSGVLKRDIYKEFISAVKTVFFVTVLVALYLFAVQLGGDFSRFVLASTAILYTFIAVLLRSLWKVILMKNKDAHGIVKKIILITTLDRAEKIIKDFNESNFVYTKISGIIIMDKAYHHEKNEINIIADIDIVADRHTASFYLMHNWIDEVFWDIYENSYDCDELFSQLMDMGVVTHKRFGEKDNFVGNQKYMQYIMDYPVVTLCMKVLTPSQALVKRTFDILCSIVGCLLTMLLAVIIGPIIFIKSPGNIFFSQTRIGQNGKPFKIYKFRSMYPKSEYNKTKLEKKNIYNDGMMFKVDNDPRIIGNKNNPKHGIGFFIRKTSLDEFPQFFNVLMGSMSLVGTRPPTIDEWDKYEARHRSRLSVKPGITGLWQISGRNNITDFEEVIRLDREYIENWSFKLDIMIILKTILIVVKGKGAK